MPIDTKQAKAIVDRKHPLYGELLPHWDFLEASYRGGRAWFRDNIFRYIKEGDIEYRDRVCRAYRFNHTRETVDLVNKYLFRATINRKVEDAPKSVQAFWKKVDSTGLDIDEFMRVVSLKQSIFGRPWIVIDNRVTAEDLAEDASEADVPEPELYAYIVPPQQVPDYAFDEAGELLWVLIEEHIRDDADPINGSGNIHCRYRLWTREYWLLIEFVKGDEKSDGEWVQTDFGIHDLGMVPVIPANNAIGSDKWDCPALIADVAYLDRAVSNYASNLDAIIQDQAFSQLAMPAQGVLPGDDAYNKVLEMGTKRVFLYDGEGGSAPVFLSPDPRQATLILAAISQLINEIYHSVGLAGERTKQDNSQGIDNSSGVAKTMDFERVVALLSAKADALEAVEYKMIEVICAWHGEDFPEDAGDLVVYPIESQFDVRTMYDELDTAMKLRLMGLPPLVIEEQVNRLVAKLFPDLSKDVVTKIKAEVKSWSTEPTEQEKAAAATSGTTAASKTVEEAKRNRSDASQKKSDTQSRETGKTNG
jgi:hypothetical protein